MILSVVCRHDAFFIRKFPAQMQRKLESAIRHAKDRQTIAAAAGDDILRREEQAKLNMLSRKYKDFSDAAGLSTKAERAAVSGYHRVKSFDELTDKEATNLLNSLTDERKYNIINQKIESGEINLKLNVGHYNKHIKDSKSYIENKSYLTVSKEEVQSIIDDYHCTGKVFIRVHNSDWQIKEVVETDKDLGVDVEICEDDSTKEHVTNRCTIHYAKKGTHIVPAWR